MSEGLTDTQKREYAENGFTILRGLLSPAECDGVVTHMMDLHSGKKRIAEYATPPADKWDRTFNQHVWDPLASALLLRPSLRQPLMDCMGEEPEAVQTMYFWKGSEQRRHQDQYYLPGCMSAWMTMGDVGPENGTIWVQPGSHKGQLIRQGDLKDADGKTLPAFGPHYDEAVDKLFAANKLPEVPVEAKKGDVVLFHGVLIHRGGPIGRPGSFRHVLANHYIPKSFTGWPHEGWERISFDGSKRTGN